jgi:hypothetical protein
MYNNKIMPKQERRSPVYCRPVLNKENVLVLVSPLIGSYCLVLYWANICSELSLAIRSYLYYCGKRFKYTSFSPRAITSQQ